ncbi:hypothetical protein IU474_10355 [Nocardia otitidiscaviarum]|uniref:hypothetical protein n=1 Tax=Nocardia otitidiscaviarum TaxID=1823 RepID=UPI001894A546|nr:hypothetical protein [Nocardia otitidiscaviarum]MBF6237470.1 hypothetical protein [Nocardia otitidiscaviarum]
MHATDTARGVAAVTAVGVIAALASLGAATIHLAAASEHYDRWAAAGVFFYAVAAFQAGWAIVALWRRAGRLLMWAGLLVNAGVIATWVLSRTSGPPIGPSAGVPEPVTRAGVTAVVLESVICVAALWLLSGWAREASVPAKGAIVAVGVAAAAGAGFTVPAFETALQHQHSPRDGTHQHEDGHEPRDQPIHRPEPSGTAPTSQTPAPRMTEPHPDDHGPHGH